MSITLEIGQLRTLLVNVYCPYDYRKEALSQGFRRCMLVIGDFVDPKIFIIVIFPGRFFKEREDILSRSNMVIGNVIKLPAESFTYISKITFVVLAGWST